MANNCAIDIRITGKESAVRELVQMLRWEGPYENCGLGRVFTFDLDESLTEHHPEDNSIISVQGFGDCANSIKSAIKEWSPYNLENACERLGVVVEAYSSDPRNRFQEHYFCNKGVLEAADCVLYEEYFLEDMRPEDIEELAQEKDLTVDELWAKRNHNGEFTVGGFENYCEFQDVFSYFEPVKEQKFIFEDELIPCEDSASKCINGYLWAMEPLVTALKEQEARRHQLSSEQLESMENINFYADYNVDKKTISVSGTYYFAGNDTESFPFNLPLSAEDTADLKEAMEQYCQKLHGKSCLEVVNERRREDGLLSISDMLRLVERLKYAEAIEYKGIVFDDWTVDEEYDSIWGEMCQGCAEKYKDAWSYAKNQPIGELDDGSAIGTCSVKGCNVVGLESGDDKHYYIDFKPALIQVIDRKMSLDRITANAEARAHMANHKTVQNRTKESSRDRE